MTYKRLRARVGYSKQYKHGKGNTYDSQPCKDYAGYAIEFGSNKTKNYNDKYYRQSLQTIQPKSKMRLKIYSFRNLVNFRHILFLLQYLLESTMRFCNWWFLLHRGRQRGTTVGLTSFPRQGFMINFYKNKKIKKRLYFLICLAQVHLHSEFLEGMTVLFLIF